MIFMQHCFYKIYSEASRPCKALVVNTVYGHIKQIYDQLQQQCVLQMSNLVKNTQAYKQ